jgi:ACS family hexuronate transporter-like MFS transporter
VNFARKTAMWIAAALTIPMVVEFAVHNFYLSVVIMSLATAGHQAFSSNLYTLVSDMFPKRATASVSGLGGMFGYLGAAAFQTFVGFMVAGHGYFVPFLCAGSAYIVANLLIHILAPRLEAANLGDATNELASPIVPV